MNEYRFKLPAHHVYEDASVNEVFVKAYEDCDWMVVVARKASLVLTSDQARTLARVLLIAADKLEKELAREY